MLFRSAVVVALVGCSSAPSTQVAPKGALPLKYRGPATSTAITAGDLMTRLYIYADDSMNGRLVGSPDNIRATAYIEREVRKLGLVPAGDNGSYFQYLPLYARKLAPASVFTAGMTKLVAGSDFTATTAATRAGTVIYGGVMGDTVGQLSPDVVAGKIVVLKSAPGFAQPNMTVYGGAVAIVVVAADKLPGGPARATMTENPASLLPAPSTSTLPIRVTATTGAAARLFGKPLEQVTKGATAGAGTIDLKFTADPSPGRNVIAILPGTDPVLKHQYVLIGAHNDHVGYNTRPMDHDSAKAFNKVFLVQGADSRPSPDALKDPAMWAKVNAEIAAARRVHAARPDSIYNGADDDGSGSMTVLEIAEAFAKGTVKPKRSVIFIWQTGEESGMWGSGWFVDHPTVPRDSIVGAVNMDMVGRGFATDATGNTKEGALMFGGPGYLQLVGSRRLSKEFGDLVETVNSEAQLGFKFDYNIDADGHPQNIYCRSDHWSYAKYGIPVVFFTTGGHADYHQVTDEPQYINYPHMAEVSKLSFAMVLKLANLDHRVKLDKSGPFNPKARCQQ
jgi:hypothetical protein